MDLNSNAAKSKYLTILCWDFSEEFEQLMEEHNTASLWNSKMVFTFIYKVGMLHFTCSRNMRARHAPHWQYEAYNIVICASLMVFHQHHYCSNSSEKSQLRILKYSGFPTLEFKIMTLEPENESSSGLDEVMLLTLIV